MTSRGLSFPSDTIDSVYLSLRTKPFLILTGLSGTGKTKIALALQDLLCDAGHRAFVPVRPDWTDAKGLFGYHNLLTDQYQSTATLRLLLAAEREWNRAGSAARPYILLLDEMNLARVEHYFSDFLSALESRRPGDAGMISEAIPLHDVQAGLSQAGGAGSEDVIPPQIGIPLNFYVVGTVNIDETTHPFSRKVLDRANTIELFDVDLRQLTETAESEIVDRAGIERHFTRNGQFAYSDVPFVGNAWLDELVRVNEVLARHRMQFGYRVRNEVLNFIDQAGREGFLGSEKDAQARAFDLQLMQKVLPRLSGSRERLEKPLRTLLALTIGAQGGALIGSLGDRYEELYQRLSAIPGEPRHPSPDRSQDGATAASPGDAAQPADEPSPTRASSALAELDTERVRYPRAARKIARMLLQLHDEGYSSFFE